MPKFFLHDSLTTIGHLTVDIVIIWTPCFKILFFQVPNKVPEFITPDPLVLKGHTVPHFKGLVCTYME